MDLPFARQVLTLANSAGNPGSKGKGTFDLSDGWKSNCAALPAFAYVLRAVLTNSPNSCPPERLFSIFTYNDDS